MRRAAKANENGRVEVEGEGKMIDDKKSTIRSLCR